MYHNFQQVSDALVALEIKVGLRKAPAPPQTEVQAAQQTLDEAIKRAKEQAAK